MLHHGPGGNQTGKPRNSGHGAATRVPSDETFYGLHVLVSQGSTLVKTLAELGKTDGSVGDFDPCPVRVNDVHRGLTKTDRGKFPLTLDGQLVLGVHNTNQPNACFAGGTIPVTTAAPPYKVLAYAVDPIREGRIQIRNQNNQGALVRARRSS